MTRWTAEEYRDYMAKHDINPMVADSGPESKLQGKITKYCKDHGYPCLSFRQSRKAEGFLVPGWPDITLCLPKGRVVFIELKAKHGHLRQKQGEIRGMMEWLDHEWYLVKSYKQFLSIVDK